MPIQVNDTVDWTYNGLTTEATVLEMDPRLGVTIQYTNNRGKLVQTRVPLRELTLTEGSGLRMYRVDAGADDLALLRVTLPDLGVKVQASYPHYLIVATNDSRLLSTMVQALPSISTRRLPGRLR